ncbi:MAG: hypothetical protein UX43_C0004G0024 [Candidatus Giovannonibacteria bacterium GW2011_GWB1_46_20]|uniref:Uncharacterized protein n=1 Tax=Candidatus Giovannonibacteria bacterium GW2011_GWA1_44_25 TaxID=1618645 RepID=A0A0G1KU52_9BACT|nr:MAG: hypothetical protein UW15_C0006G0020 [Parcubacteria group bacterium GW2011_GWC1_44_10]KKT59877.1 MAG: hypothetical protein UW53_C0006G0024 [Candidatus Giovannonibacteria bacterium GW2011_GWA1_44_25]KKU29863.1 MAG: hypothetical protein UX43_C0004G0024 [Candidatus Giovannonibacteria bacterium GW2011_GWB1_46_20]
MLGGIAMAFLVILVVIFLISERANSPAFLLNAGEGA